MVMPPFKTRLKVVSIAEGVGFRPRIRPYPISKNWGSNHVFYRGVLFECFGYGPNARKRPSASSLGFQN